MATRTRSRSRSRKKRPKPHPTRRTDLIGLGLVAASVFAAFVIYLGWEGGEAGSALLDGAEWLIGAVHWFLPLFLFAGGVVLVLSPVLPAVKPFRAAGICLAVALLLALAAGTLGVGPSGPRPGAWDADYVRPRGGMLGEALFVVVSTLLGTIGAHVIAVFLALAGTLLLTGASVAGIVAAGGERVRTTTIRRPARVRVPEPAGVEPVVRRTAEYLLDEDEEEDAFEPPPALTAAADPEDEEPTVEQDELPYLAEDAEEEGVTRVTPGPQRQISAGDLTPQGRYRASVTDDESFVWELPDPQLLPRSSAEQLRPDTAGQEQIAAQLIEALGHHKIEAEVINRVAGPHITRYELSLAPGIKVGRVASLKDDIAYALAAADVRILAPIPGKRAVGVEVPNLKRRIVHLGDVFTEAPEGSSPLTVFLGKDVAGRGIVADLKKMPHLLVAGTTGAGKSACINAMLCSILLRASPHEVRMVLVDPKQVELTPYQSIPHLLTPIVTSPKKAANALQNLVRVMEERYGEMSVSRARKIEELNRIRVERGQAPHPYVLCVIDELADLMMVAPADVEDAIIRLAQKARAVGIHLVLATQSPRVDVITGLIKANVPSRIAFAVSSQTDSRVILDQNGAETLLGMGDMLFSPVGSTRLQRIQGAFVDDAQVHAVTEAWRRQGEPELQEELLEEAEEEVVVEAPEDALDPDDDPLLEEAIALVASLQTASTSMLQRRLRLGYTRAGRLIDMLERRGVISGYEGSKPRQVLITEADLPRVLAALRSSDPDL